jgi:hypothetical protein
MSKRSIRLQIPFRVWSKAVDEGTLPQIRAYLRAVEKIVDDETGKQMANLIAFGSTHPK